MKIPVRTWIFILFTAVAFAQEKVKTIHVFVALCDNENQGIVPVPRALGDGRDPDNNLYWGALYGTRTFFKKSSDWRLINTIRRPTDNILERIIFLYGNKTIERKVG